MELYQCMNCGSSGWTKYELKEDLCQDCQKDEENKTTCPKCGCSDYEEWEEQEYEKGGDDPMYGGRLIWIKITRCGNCD